MEHTFLISFLTLGIFGFFIFPPVIFISDSNFDLKQAGTGSKNVAQNLNVPWEIAWGPDNKIWIAEQQGLISRIDPLTGSKEILLKLNDVWQLRTSGLLGMALHTDMKKNPYVFLKFLNQIF